MQAQRCVICGGSGTIMGGGMIFVDCAKCNGRGKIVKPDDDISYLQLQQSESYKDAINEIKSIDPKITSMEADKLLKKQFDKRRVRIKK